MCAQSQLIFVTSWTVACQAPLFREFFRQEYWSGLPFTTPGDLLDPGMEPTSLVSPTLFVLYVFSCLVNYLSRSALVVPM